MVDPAPISPPPGAAAPSVRGWTRIILIVSLALNVLFVGLFAGAVLRDGPPGRGNRLGELNMGPVTEAFSAQERDQVRRAFLRAWPDMRAQRNEMQGDVAALMQVLRAPVLDRAALEAIFARQSDRSQRRLQQGQVAVLDVIAAMSPEARLAFVDRLEAALKKRPRGAGP